VVVGEEVVGEEPAVREAVGVAVEEEVEVGVAKLPRNRRSDHHKVRQPALEYWD